jgi:UDP-2,3-diacylglucosamine pyrophosphatase LpxH
LRRSWYWHQAHNDVVQKLLRKARKGTHVVYVPGNHDEPLRDYTEMQFGGVTILEETIHVTADGRRLLVLHGDKFDGIVKYARWLAILGDRAYSMILELNHWYNLVRRRLGYPYWSLSAYIKGRVKDAVRYIEDFELAIAEEARKRGVDGVVCGHIHHAAQRDVGGIRYMNCGDWVESCTAIAEDATGKLHVIDWLAAMRERERGPAEAPRLREAA